MPPFVLSAGGKEKVKKQVEFYFGDSNIYRDKFLMEKIRAHPQGYVELAIIAAFTRMAQHLGREAGQRPDEIPDSVIRELANALQGSEEVQVSGDRLFVRRKTPLADKHKALQDMDKRTIYIRPFPYDSTLEQLQNFFKPYGIASCVRMRRFPTSKDFKGSVFVEFEDEETANKVAAAKDLVFEGAPLRPEMKAAYLQRKLKERAEQAKNGTAQPDQTQNAQNTPASEWPGQRVPHFIPGLVVEFILEGEVEMPTDLHYSTVKQAFGGKEAGVGFVEFPKGERKGRVRLISPDAKEKLYAKKAADGFVPVGNMRAKLRVLEGNEEKQFYIRAERLRQENEAAKRSGGGDFVVGKRKQDFGDRGRGRGRGRGRFGRAGRINP